MLVVVLFYIVHVQRVVRFVNVVIKLIDEEKSNLSD